MKDESFVKILIDSPPLQSRGYPSGASLPRQETEPPSVQCLQRPIARSSPQAADPTPAAPVPSALASEAAAATEGSKRRRHERVLVDVHNAAPSDRVGSSPENIYERERLQRMKRNAEMMHQLGLQHMATDLATAPTRDASEAPAPARRRGATKPKRGTRAPTRQSARTRRAQGLDAVDHDHLDDTTERDTAADMLDKAPLDEDLLDLESYFKLIGKDVSGALQSDGCFRGWIAPDVALKMGIALTEDGAPPPGAAACAMSGRPKGWSGARANAYAQRHKNPNAYFYRHVAPDQQQAQGEWSQEEHELFMRTAREHGVGDRWGLFASYVPQRVGYQCSAYYRDVIIPSGLVLDARFKMQRNGKAVFVG